MEIVVKNEILEDRRIPLLGEMLLVGRDPQVHLRLESRGISRFHARLELDGEGAWCVVDLGSANGTFVNEERIESRVRLEEGDALRFGSVRCELTAGVSRGVLLSKPTQPPRRRSLRRPAIVVSAVLGLAGLGFGMMKLLQHEDELRRNTAETQEATPRRETNPRPPAPSPVPHGPIGEPPPSAPPTPHPPPPPQETKEPSGPPLVSVTLAQGNVLRGHRVESDDPIWIRILEPGTHMPLLIPKEQVTALDGVPFVADLGKIFAARSKLAGDEVPTLLKLADWCGDVGLLEEQKALARRITDKEPGNTVAWTYLGKYRYRGELSDKEELLRLNALDDEGRLLGTTEDMREIRRLYFDALGRPPRRSEWRDALTIPREALIGRLFAGKDPWIWWLEDICSRVVGAEAAVSLAPQLSEIAERLAFGDLDLRGAYRWLFNSDSMKVVWSDSATFAEAVLEEVLGGGALKDTALQQSAVSLIEGQRVALFGERGASRADFVDIVLRQPTFFKRLVYRESKRCLGRELTAQELNRASLKLATSPDALPKLQQEWLLISAAAASPSKASRKMKSTPQFLRGLFLDAIGHLPTVEEWQRAHAILRGLEGPGLRSVLIDVLCRSFALQTPAADDPHKGRWLEEKFALLWARRPNAKERESFFSAPPRDALRALLLSPEYQEY